MVQDFQAGRFREDVDRRLVTRLDRLDVRKPLAQFADETDDFLPGLVPHATHHVDFARSGNRSSSTHRDDVRPLQGIAGTSAQTQGRDRCPQCGLFQRDAKNDLFAAGRRDLPLFGLLEDLPPRASASRRRCRTAVPVPGAAPCGRNATSPSRTLGSNFSASMTSSSSVRAGSDLPLPHCGSTPAPSVIS